MNKDDIFKMINECDEHIGTSVWVRDWNMVKAWEERKQFWVDQLFDLGTDDL